MYDGALFMVLVLVAREKCRGVHFLEREGGEGWAVGGDCLCCLRATPDPELGHPPFLYSKLYWVWLPGVVLMLVLMGWRCGEGGLGDAETGGQVMKVVITVPLDGTEGEQG